jgi:FkbM family methyltransferase
MYITIQEIKAKYNARLKGIVHLGAHLGEEAKDYAEVGCGRVIWVEGNPSLINELKSNLAAYPGNQVFNILVSDKDNSKVVFNITEFSQSSSILELGVTKEIHNTKVVERKELTTRRIDSFFGENGVDMQHYNFLNIDLQGYELMALKSMGGLLDNIDWIYTEVNSRHLYKKCTLMDELDRFLLKKGFRRVELYMTGWRWGDALYRRQKIGAMEYAGASLGIFGWSVKNRVLGPALDQLPKMRSFLGRIKRRLLKGSNTPQI